ncbi:phosphotransferase family protein [Kribbella sp. DT2]|uniref:phosphotransferase family protein n=1 Tax=Kribbella sp. DT2 TaxID=3393427 RepID=UPI003CF30FBB
MDHDVAGMVRTALPGWDVAEILPRSGGQLSTVFEVRGVDGRAVIVKVYDPEWAWKQAKEVYVYGVLTPELGELVPSVIHAEPAGETHAFTVLSKVDGVPLSEVTPADYRPIYAQAGALLTRIHRIPQPAYGYLTDQVLEPLPSNDQYMARQFAKKLKEFEELGGDPELQARITEYVAEHPVPPDVEPVLCHNDFHEGNLLVDPETWQLNGIIDVENAIAADPLLDLAKAFYYSIKDDRAKLDGLLDGYGELPADWEERTTTYRLYHALELWDWFTLIGVTDPLDSIAGDIAEILGTRSVAR